MASCAASLFRDELGVGEQLRHFLFEGRFHGGVHTVDTAAACHPIARASLRQQHLAGLVRAYTVVPGVPRRFALISEGVNHLSPPCTQTGLIAAFHGITVVATGQGEMYDGYCRIAAESLDGQ
jgi:hypothetical protein